MFLDKTVAYNPELVDFAFHAHKNGLLPDTYLIDLDTIQSNAELMLKAAKEYDVTLYFMLKQLGRNPMIAEALNQMGFAGAVCVDFKEALVMVENNITLGNIGHLVQIPKAALERILKATPDIMTVYTLEKAKEISEIAGKLGIRQPIMPRVVTEGDNQYSGQHAGFQLTELETWVSELAALDHVEIAGVCSFPCFLFDEELRKVVPTRNLDTVLTAVNQLESLGYQDLQVNTPSVSCKHTMPLLAASGGTHGEPGHGLTGTTPYHAAMGTSSEELPAVVYLSEISHNYDGLGYCYGGGYYRRGHLKDALVGTDLESAVKVGAIPPTDESIDYHLQLKETFPVSSPVVMSFRTQIFTTRSDVAIVKGLKTGNPVIAGIYTATGQKLR